MLTSLADGRIWAERYGDGEPSIFALHGWARSRHDWSGTLAGYDALAVDLPGFGASPAPETARTTAEYADLLAPLVSQVPHPILVGHSFGGRVAVQIAARHPGTIAGLVLTGVPLLRTGGPTRKPAFRYRAGRWLNRHGVVSDTRMEKLRNQYGSADYRAASGIIRDVLVRAVNEDYGAQLAQVAEQGVPTVLVWGENDTTVPLAVATASLEILGSAGHLDVVPGSGHLLDGALAAHIGAAITSLGSSDARS